MTASLHERLNVCACRIMVLATRHQASLPEGVADELLGQIMALLAAVDDLALVEALVAEIGIHPASAAAGLG